MASDSKGDSPLLNHSLTAGNVTKGQSLRNIGPSGVCSAALLREAGQGPLCRPPRRRNRPQPAYGHLKIRAPRPRASSPPLSAGME